MTTRRRHAPALLIALAAIAAVLSCADVASACSSSRPDAGARKGCCASRPSSDCACCERPAPAAPKAAAPASVADARLATLASDAPGDPCGCRSDAPAAPAERRAAPAPTTASDVASFSSPTDRPARAAAVARSRPPDPDPGGRRLHLRLSHLLI